MLRILAGLDAPDSGRMYIESHLPRPCVYICGSKYPFDLDLNGIDSFHEPIRQTLLKIVKEHLVTLGGQTGMWDVDEMVDSILLRAELGHLPFDIRGNGLSGSDIVRFSCAIAMAECCLSLVPPIFLLDDTNDRADAR